MTHCTKSVHWRAVNLTLLALLAVVPSMGSQLPSDARVGLETGLPPSMLKNGSLGELMAVYIPRNHDELQHQLDFARSSRESAEKDITESRRLADAADGRVRIMNEEVRTTRTRLSVAKKAKNQSDSSSLAVELKRQQAELKYVERLRDANRADATRLDSESTAASARVKALEFEMDVAKKYDEIIEARPDTSPDIASYQDLLKRMLAAQQDAADRGADAASRQKDLATRRLKQLDALSKLKH